MKVKVRKISSVDKVKVHSIELKLKELFIIVDLNKYI